MTDPKPAARRIAPKPRPRRGLLAVLSLAGMLVVLGGGITAGVLMSRKDSGTPKPGPAPEDPNAAKVASLVATAHSKLEDLRALSRRKGDVRTKMATLAQEIVQHTTEALALDPACAAACYDRGLAKWLSNDAAGALEDIGKARQLDAADHTIHYAHARLRLERIMLARRLGDTPEDPAPLVADFQALAGFKDAPSTARVAALYLEGKLAAAMEACTVALDRDDSSEDLQRLSGAIAEAQGFPPLAIKAFDRALELRPNSPDSLSGRAFARYRNHEFEGAEADATAAAAVLQHRALRTLLGQIHIARRNYAAAARDFADDPVSLADVHLAMRKYDDAIRTVGTDTSVRGLLIKARALLWQAKVDEGRAVIGQAMKIDPASPDPFIARAEIGVILGKLEEAMADATKAVELRRTAKSLCARGDVYRAKGESGPARDDYRAAKDLDSFEPRAHVGLAKVLESMGESANALFAIEQAVKLDPNNPEFLVTRAGLRAGERDYDAALRDITRALEIDPTNPDAYSERAMIHLRKGDVDKAMDDIKKAVELRPVDKSTLEKILKKEPPK